MNLFVEELVYRLACRDKPAVLVLYGDHLPGFEWSQEEMKNGSLYQTQYVIWNNVGLPKLRKDLEAYQLTAHLLNLLHIHEGTMTRFHQYHLDQGDVGEEDYLEAMQVLEYDILYGDQRYMAGSRPMRQQSFRWGFGRLFRERPSVRRRRSWCGDRILMNILKSV